MKFSKIKAFLTKYEARLSWGAMITGFVVDNLTLSRIDLWLDNIILSSYLVIAGGSIILFNYLSESSRIRLFIPYILQYALGGLFSGFVIFYSRSGTIIQSWPFLIVLLSLLVGNEMFKERYERFVFRIGIYFVALFSFFIFFIPVLIGKMGALQQIAVKRVGIQRWTSLHQAVKCRPVAGKWRAEAQRLLWLICRGLRINRCQNG